MHICSSTSQLPVVQRVSWLAVCLLSVVPACIRTPDGLRHIPGSPALIKKKMEDVLCDGLASPPPPLFVCVRFINSSLLQPSLRRKRKGAHREPCFFSSGLFFSVLSAFHSSTYLLFRAKLLGLVIFVSSLPCWLLHLRSRSLTGRCCSHGFWCCVGIEAWLDGLSLFVLVNSSSALISYKTNNRSQWWVLLWP